MPSKIVSTENNFRKFLEKLHAWMIFVLRNLTDMSLPILTLFSNNFYLHSKHVISDFEEKRAWNLPVSAKIHKADKTRCICEIK